MKRILIIDDEASVRDVFEFALSRLGYQVECAASGEEGVLKAKEHRPDLVFLDLRMPGIDGVETLRLLQQLESSLPVYIVTAFQKEYSRSLHQAARDGLHFQVADKPLSIDQIQAIARGALEGVTNIEGPA